MQKHKRSEGILNGANRDAAGITEAENTSDDSTLAEV